MGSLKVSESHYSPPLGWGRMRLCRSHDKVSCETLFSPAKDGPFEAYVTTESHQSLTRSINMKSHTKSHSIRARDRSFSFYVSRASGHGEGDD